MCASQILVWPSQIDHLRDGHSASEEPLSDHVKDGQAFDFLGVHAVDNIGISVQQTVL